MSFEFAVSPEQRLARVTVRGADDFLSSDEAVRSLTRAPGFEPGMPVLVDLREASYEPSFEGARRLAALHGDPAALQGHRTALVVKHASYLGSSRLAVTLAEFLGADVRLFSDVEEALAWLGKR
jgi:hypothetical protein